ncbi:uncharacterized protein DDB_G0290685-like [Ochlerotatus camptorhynchus]|uniref:uncharacterized protein DDB_G0290685-like n=1 Tax=Ochlerotatus camptorhynchus TaxID=644619 RepID=UPI0031DF9DFD
MVQWFKPVLLLAALLVTAESASRRNKYEVSVKHGPFEIHQRHVNAKPFKEPSRDKTGSIGQNNPQIGYRKEVSRSEEIYEPRKKGRKRDEKWEPKMRSGTQRHGSSSNRGMKNSKLSGSWSYTTTFEPSTEPSTTNAPMYSQFGQRQPGVARKTTTTQLPHQEENWISSTPIYQNYEKTERFIDPNLSHHEYVPDFRKMPLKPITFYKTQSESYGKIRNHEPIQSSEENDFQRTTVAPQTEQNLIVVNPVTPSVLFRNPQLRVPFNSDKIGPTQFIPPPKETTSTTAAPTTTTTTTTTVAPTTTTAPSRPQEVSINEIDDSNTIYLLVKYEKPHNGKQAKANVLEILGKHSQVVQNIGRSQLRKDFNQYPNMEETVRESLKNVNLNSVEVTTAGYSVSENLGSDENNQISTPLALVGPPMRGDQTNQANQNRLPSGFPIQQNLLAQNYLQQQQNSNGLQHNFQFTTTQPNRQVTQDIQRPVQIQNPQAFQTGFIVPTTFWGLQMNQVQQQQPQLGYIQHNAFRIQHMPGQQQFGQMQNNNNQQTVPNSQQASQIKLEDQGDPRIQLDRSSKTPVEEPSGNSLQQNSQSEEYSEPTLRDSYGKYVSEDYQDYDEAKGARRPDTQNTEAIVSSMEAINETTDPLELTRILVSRNGGLTVEQFNRLFKDYLDKELTESDLDSYEHVLEAAGGSGRSSSGTQDGQSIMAMAESGESFEQNQQQQHDNFGRDVSGSSEADDEIRVQINKIGGRQEPIVKIGYGSSKSHQGVYKSPKFFEKLRESSREEDQTEQWEAPEPPQQSGPRGFEDNPVFGFSALKGGSRQQQQQQENNQKFEESQKQQEQQENSVREEPTNSGHQGGLSYIKFEKFN